ncbi:hypothetical protein [Aquabacterium sp. OR-4]|nr:hypothetical protein [Aquabacterium sp. OR-4]MDT7839091.1 hypothetical protein [Aquabacterium sp. OR-4]
MSATVIADIARIAHWKQLASAHDTDRMLRWSLPRWRLLIATGG